VKPPLARINWLMMACTLAACASATVSRETRNAPVTSVAPSRVVVYPFATNPSEVTLNQNIFRRAYGDLSGEDVPAAQSQVAHQAALTICWKVVSTLKSRGISSSCIQRGDPPGIGNLMVIDGEFTKIHEGDPASRVVVGFGIGAAVLNANVYVYQTPGTSSYYQVLSFKAHADSGAMPGMAVSKPVALFGGGATSSQTATNDLGQDRARDRTSDLQVLPLARMASRWIVIRPARVKGARLHKDAREELDQVSRIRRERAISDITVGSDQVHARRGGMIGAMKCASAVDDRVTLPSGYRSRRVV
jgi:Domain of unknown function (DUF4410)